MKKLGLIVLVGGLLVTASMYGCGARTEVTKEKVLEKIDTMLGSMDVKRKQIEHSVDALKEGLIGLRKAKIKAQVQSDQMERKIGPIERDMSAIDSTLKTMKVHLASGSAVEIAGRTRTCDELNRMAQRVIQQRGQYVEQLSGLHNARARLQKVASTLEREQLEHEQTLQGIEGQLAVVDSNRIALKAMKDAARTMDGSDRSLARNVAQLEEQVNDLYAAVEAELIGEDANWDDVATKRELDSVEAIVDSFRTANDTMAYIDSIFDESSNQMAAK